MVIIWTEARRCEDLVNTCCEYASSNLGMLLRGMMHEKGNFGMNRSIKRSTLSGREWRYVATRTRAMPTIETDPVVE